MKKQDRAGSITWTYDAGVKLLTYPVSTGHVISKTFYMGRSILIVYKIVLIYVFKE